MIEQKVTAKNSVDSVRMDIISGMKPYSPEFLEQQKIASFLSLIDDRITTQNKIIEELTVFKGAMAKKIFSQQLRFSEFSDEWKAKKLEDICTIKKGEQLNKDSLTEFGVYPCLNGGINPSGYTEKYNSDENTITISEGGNSCGYINYMKTKFWLGGHCYKILAHENINQDYFYQLLKFNESKIMNLRVGSGLPNIQQNTLRNFELMFCNSFGEQTKIASFLSCVDEKIEMEKKILQQYENQKKYFLQQMFI
ncbi:restriction endonuclease subunit S [Paracnuella aquatica]